MAQDSKQLDRERASRALDKHLEELAELEAAELEDELQAHAFCQKQLRKQEAADREDAEEKRKDRTADFTTEVLQIVTAPAVGAVSTMRTENDIPAGAVTNYVLGFGFKTLSGLCALGLIDSRAARVAGRVGKVLLHSQLSITSRNIIKGQRN